MLSLKKSFTEQPARPEDAQAQAQAHEDAQAQDDAQAHDDPPPREEPPERCVCDDERERLAGTGTLMTFT